MDASGELWLSQQKTKYFEDTLSATDLFCVLYPEAGVDGFLMRVADNARKQFENGQPRESYDILLGAIKAFYFGSRRSSQVKTVYIVFVVFPIFV